ncbi:unnamed protein product [Adineta ricciae]|uniref:EGF-like domain-containing protein n=1 Tax=Adineta ricciae TaxID=249248 RepID=A0A814UGF6_ADIRI|nr:unnamed protein product [Adineta ricciae]
MNDFQCGRDISFCLSVCNLTLCSPENNTCVADHGYCVFSDKVQPKCICLPCFIGKYCEDEKVSRNLWSFFAPYGEIAENGAYIPAIIIMIWGAFLLMNGICCLQTYLCRKIRETNLGIYLIMLSIVSLFIGLILIIFASLFLRVKDLPDLDLFADFHCIIYEKFVYIPLVSMYNWFIACVGIERALVACSRDYELHDSRRRSVIVSVLVVIICPLTALPGLFTVRQNQPAELRPMQCVNFTPVGYILQRICTDQLLVGADHSSYESLTIFTESISGWVQIDAEQLNMYLAKNSSAIRPSHRLHDRLDNIYAVLEDCTFLV